MIRSRLKYFISGTALATSALVGLSCKAAGPGATVPTNLVNIFSVDTSKVPWETLVVPQTGARIPFKPIFEDKETGQTVFLVRYPAGFTNVWHTHPAAHAMFVLDGTLRTHQGEFGPGNYVHFPEGGWMFHGATEKNDVTFLFITNKKFGISYEGDAHVDYPMFKR